MGRRIQSIFVLFISLWCNFLWAEPDREGSNGFYWPIGTSNFDTDNGSWLSTPSDGGYFSGLCHIGEDMMTRSEDHNVYAVADLRAFFVSVNGWSLRDDKDTHENVGILFLGTAFTGSKIFKYVLITGHISKNNANFLGNINFDKSTFVNKEISAGEIIGKTGFYIKKSNTHAHIGVWIVPDNMFNDSQESILSAIKKDSSEFGRVSQDKCDGIDRKSQNKFGNFVKPSWFFKEYKPHNKEVAEVIRVHQAHGSYGLVVWEERYASCWNAPKVWIVSKEGILMIPVDKETGCGFLDDFWWQGLLFQSGQEASLLEPSKQGLLSRASEGIKDSLAYAADFAGLVKIAQASEYSKDQYFGDASPVTKAILYKDGLLKLIGTEDLSNVYGPSDIQLSEATPSFTGHPEKLPETNHDGKLPDMVVDDLWLRKKGSGENSHDHNFTVTDFYSDNVEWRVKVKNQGPGTKKKDKTVTVQVHLWKTHDDGDETMVEGVGKEEVNKKMVPGDTTPESESPEDFRRLIKYPGEYFITASLLTANSFKEENKKNNFGGPYRFTVKNLSDLVTLSVSSADGRTSYVKGEAASFHASFQLDGDRLPKKARARVAWRLVGPSFQDGKIMETDRIKSSSLDDRRGNTHGENLENVVLDFEPGEYELQAIVNPECTLSETNCSNNTGSFRFTIEAPALPSDPNHEPIGAIETYDCTKITGWAKDPDTTDSLSIQVSAANPDGTNERLLETAIANLPRSDKGGNYGIEWTPPSSIKDGQPRKVSFTAVNVPEGQNQVIGTVPLTCASSTPAPNPTPTPEQPPTPAPTPNPVPNVPSPIPFTPGCGVVQQDISTPPSQLGPVGGIRIGTNHHRLFLSASLSPLGAKGFWNPIPSFNPPAVTRVCWNSNSVDWTVKNSRACSVSGFVLDGPFWVADIPNTPAADTDGTWSLEYAGTEYWFNPEDWGMPIDPKTDHHVSYGIKEENRVEFSVTQDSIATLSGTFGTTGAPGFSFPSGITEQQLTGDAFWFNDKEGYPGTPGVLLCDASTGRLSFNIPTVPPGSEGAVILSLINGGYAWQLPKQWILPTGAELHIKPDGSRYKLPSVPVAVQGSTAGYDPVAQTLTLTIPSDGRMKYAFWSIGSLNQITDTAWFMAWISPTGQGVQNIQGSISRSDTGVWTILFKGVSPGLGGSVYLKLTNGTNAWQNVPAFAYGSGIVMENHPERNEAWYVMPK